jgi:hypothetical protein
VILWIDLNWLEMRFAAMTAHKMDCVSKSVCKEVTKCAFTPTQGTPICLPLVWRLLFVSDLEGSGRGLIKEGTTIPAFGWRD